ncbi:MAG TPA: NUDIX hydrolase [Bosea sp. (in: a-proteobacteria)]|jgi:8-oxo-dGTP pyrophosphatase MutT (NUDIX family)|uniref:NUDIX hydrolase n=1 Tax=Bosea sp. (in: a-proteobacteria) TaxID=1871050 RepID=UPI002E13CC49|nr:NUDIX hydrolase [Bosea sp. (in: a-proteobacteria)]
MKSRNSKNKPLLAKPRRQVGAIPYRKTERGLEVLLVTTRTTGRWTVPKGWPMKGLKAHDAAAIEAWEEAGVIGQAKKRAVGRYLYWKRMDGYFVLCRVKLFPIIVQEERAEWPEQSTRRRYWFTPLMAADLVEEPGLKKAMQEITL